MPIDWFTVGAQILNFLVLVWILKRFLYQPVLRAIAERQARVDGVLADAASLKEKAVTELAKLEGERSELEDTRKAAMLQAQTDAEAERQRLIAEARTEFDTARARWRSALQREQDAFHREISEQAQREVMEIADKLLRDLADADLQEKILGKFLGLMANLDETEKATLRDALRNSGTESATVRSAFELPEERREVLATAVRAIVGEGVPVVFEVKPSLGCGIEVGVDGHKIAWTLEDYLRSLDAWVRGLSVKEGSSHE
jgi:F-type H+-transporting ATPase subunit b